MVGKINISGAAEATKQLFMALEKNAKKIESCWFCNTPLSTMKLAHKGHLHGNHTSTCPFGTLALAGEKCIELREIGSSSEKADAESLLANEIKSLINAMNGRDCPFPVCQYSSGHRLECPFHAFERDTRNF